MSKTYKKNQGPKSLFKRITELLTLDTDLRGMVAYTTSNPNIRRAFQPTGEWKTLVIYYLQPEYPIQDFSPNIRAVPVIVKIYNRDNDLDLIEIGERIIQLLDGADLTIKGFVHCYDCSYTGEVGSIYYDEKEKANIKTLRFLVTFRKEDDSNA